MQSKAGRMSFLPMFPQPLGPPYSHPHTSRQTLPAPHLALVLSISLRVPGHFAPSCCQACGSLGNPFRVLLVPETHSITQGLLVAGKRDRIGQNRTGQDRTGQVQEAAPSSLSVFPHYSHIASEAALRGRTLKDKAGNTWPKSTEVFLANSLPQLQRRSTLAREMSRWLGSRTLRITFIFFSSAIPSSSL